MSRKKKLAVAILAVLAVAIVVGLLNWRSTPSGDVDVRLFFRTTQPEMVELHWSTLDKYSADWSVGTAYPNTDAEIGEVAEARARVRTDKTFLRVDLGSQEMVWTITGIVLECGEAREELSDEFLLHPMRVQDVESITRTDAGIEVMTKAGDPQLVYRMTYDGIKAELYKANEASDIRMRFFALGAFLAVCVFFVVFRKKLLAMPMEIIRNRGLVLKLAKNDFKTKYAGSYLGIVWAFVQPVVTVLVYWLVFSIGFRSSYGPMPFVMYLVCGIVPWFFIQDFLNSGTNALIEYSYLVKKVVFNISVLPMVKAVSAWFVHVFFVILAIVIAAIYGYYPSVYIVQIPYYFLCMFVFGLGLVYGTCAIVIFFRDLSQIIAIFLQIGVWTIPIMWNIEIAPENIRWLFKINPMFYVVNGYRDAIYGKAWFTEHLGMTVYFWLIALGLFAVGTAIFRRLRVHFADVL